MEALKTNGARYNILNSAIIELFDFIRSVGGFFNAFFLDDLITFFTFFTLSFETGRYQVVDELRGGELLYGPGSVHLCSNIQGLEAQIWSAQGETQRAIEQISLKCWRVIFWQPIFPNYLKCFYFKHL